MDSRKSIELFAEKKVSKILHIMTILWDGWEMDNRGWVVEFEDGSIEAFTTSHGGICKFSLKDIMSARNDTMDSVNSLDKAILLLERKDK